MQSIETTYSGPGYTRGSRIVAKSSSGKRLSTSYRPELSNEENHDRAAVMLAKSLGWTTEGFQLVRGGREKAKKEIGNVYVIFDLGQVVTLADVNTTAKQKEIEEL